MPIVLASSMDTHLLFYTTFLSLARSSSRWFFLCFILFVYVQRYKIESQDTKHWTRKIYSIVVRVRFVFAGFFMCVAIEIDS